jgi:hypothetical protein
MKVHKVYNSPEEQQPQHLPHPSLPPSLTLTLVAKSTGAWSESVGWPALPGA